ncbi:uncharacterized protein LOC144770830 [Lissotriton helveticus]
MPLAQIESRAQDTVFTLQHLTGDQRYPHWGARDLFRALAEHLKQAVSLCDRSAGLVEKSRRIQIQARAANFMLRYKGDHNHWIGLRTDDKCQSWTWVNGTKFNNEAEWLQASNLFDNQNRYAEETISQNCPNKIKLREFCEDCKAETIDLQ